MNWLEQLLGNEWEITPAGGVTGDAYFAQFKEIKLFLKRNSSPFLAVLSAEGIVPKLVWTKRMENGDVISAQQWLNGRELKPIEMNSEKVSMLLQKIHRSKDLLNMLERLGKKPLLPDMILAQIKSSLDEDLMRYPNIRQAIQFLKQELPNIQYDHKVVCHCDINHNNWLLSDQEQLYLIDWDGAMIADPAIDVGMLLHWYIPKNEWDSWLTLYGIELTEDLQARMKWYVISQAILTIKWYKSKKNVKEIQYWTGCLHDLLSSF